MGLGSPLTADVFSRKLFNLSEPQLLLTENGSNNTCPNSIDSRTKQEKECAL